MRNCNDCNSFFEPKTLSNKYCIKCSYERTRSLPNNKKYAFTDYVVTDDKHWHKERREQWNKESMASHNKLLDKYCNKTNTR